MKNPKILASLLLCSVIFLYACKDKEADARKQEARESVEVSNPITTPNATIPNPPAAEPAQNAAGVWHYTCSKGCPGGAGKAGPCATCGGTLAHNSAYHDNNNASPTIPTTNPIITPPITPPTTEPAQNANGVWHYTCAKGCAGGAGKAGPCAGCGGTLSHNASYHQ